MSSYLKFGNFRSKKLTDSARDQPCMNCGRNDGTTVSAHSNWPEHGKGASMKAADCFIAYLCGPCHAWLDQGSGNDPTKTWFDTDKREMWGKAHDKTVLHWFNSGKVQIK